MKSNRQQRRAVVAALRRGDVAIFPTESSYAIGCRIDSQTGIREIMRRKGRQDNRFTVIASSQAQVQKFFHLTSAQQRFIKRYWPGAVSLVVSKRFAVRVPQQLSLRRLAQAVRAPLIASSLNQSGQPALFNLARLDNAFTDLPQENVGKLAKTRPSTVVAVTAKGVTVLRAGSVRL